jgi:UDP-hydrolysing UDP-N-acetyl-D-glucosamine 2-epimerase
MRKIAIFTGNRAEYGLQYPIIKAVASHPELEYYLLVSGAHLDEEFGRTKDEIERDGIKVYGEVKLDSSGDDVLSTARSIGSGILSLSDRLDEIKPDILVVYADRFEGFSAVITGSQMNIPTAHIEGGDLTEGGALDDSVRHAMTKLSHIHFTTNEQAAERVRGLGEEAWRVFNVGFPALDLISEENYATPEELVSAYGLDISKPLLVFTQHSVTTEFELASDQIRPSLVALRRLAEDGMQVVITYPNNDAGGKAIIEEIEAHRPSFPENVQIHASLGRYNYHGMLNICGQVGRGVCVGNSSSGIKETPAFCCPTVNIGSRQKGRLRAGNVLDAPYDADVLVELCQKAVNDDEFLKLCRSAKNPYGVGGAGRAIADTLSSIELGTRILRKKMTY